MEFIVISGPPAVGKLTIARIVSEKFGYRLFHNHLTFDAALTLFDFGTVEFFNLCDELRYASISSAARARLPGLIFTFCFATEGDQHFLAKCAATVESEGGRCHFIVLNASTSILEQRVLAPSRKQYAKTQTVKELRRLLAAHDFTATLPGRETFRLDTGTMSAEAAAEAISDYLDSR